MPLHDAAGDGDEGPAAVDVGDDGAHERVVDVAEVLGDEWDAGADVVEMDAHVEEYEFGVGRRCRMLVVGFWLHGVGLDDIRRQVAFAVDLRLLCDAGFDAVVELAHSFCALLPALPPHAVFVGGNHDVRYDVHVSLVDPAEWALYASIQVVDVEAVDTEARVLFPVRIFAYTISCERCAGVPVDLARVHCEERVIK